jgi:hypothetical protein
VLAGQRLGVKEVYEGIWLVSFMHYELGYIDLEQKTLQTLDNPFGPRLSPNLLGTIRHPSVRTGQMKIGALGRIRTSDPQIRSLVLYPAELRAR